jgi:hypothetical protein
MLKLGRIQYQCLKIALGLMHSTHVQSLEVIGGVPPLKLRFSMLNHKYLISAFSTVACGAVEAEFYKDGSGV